MVKAKDRRDIRINKWVSFHSGRETTRQGTIVNVNYDYISEEKMISSVDIRASGRIFNIDPCEVW